MKKTHVHDVFPIRIISHRTSILQQISKIGKNPQNFKNEMLLAQKNPYGDSTLWKKQNTKKISKF